MRKLKAEIIDKLIAARATGAEIDFVIWLSHYQNEEGLVRGVYYRDAASELRMSYQTFYNVKRSLEEKGVIAVEKDERYHGDWDIRIVGNDFSGEDLAPGKPAHNYLSTGNDVFYSREFYEMKANEKLMTMLYIKIAAAGSPSYHIGTGKFFDKYTRLFGVGKRTLQNYLTGIKRFFAVGVKDREYWINPLRRKTGKGCASTDKAERAKQVARGLCRRFKLEEAQKAYQDLKELVEQYTYQVGRAADLELVLTEAVGRVLAVINGSVRPEKWRRRKISGRHVHKVMRECLPESVLL